MLWVVLLSGNYVFLFNYTATTEIYTYGHTLSLHDALPICRVQPSSEGRGVRRPSRGVRGHRRRRAALGYAWAQGRRSAPLHPQRQALYAVARFDDDPRRARRRGARRPGQRTLAARDEQAAARPERRRGKLARRPRTRFPRRSEEHTSELQSLMRNSYVVFSLQ